MSTLADCQALLQATITGAAGPVTDLRVPLPGDLVRETQRFNAASRVGVYRASYRARLVECVRDFFPCVRFAVGDEVFSSLADEFLRIHPPSHPNLSRLVDAFPSFLEGIRSNFEDAEDSSWPAFLLELADLEQASHSIYNGFGPEFSPPYSLSAPAGGPDAVPADLRLHASPCLRLKSMTYPTAEFFADFRTGKPPRFPTPRQTFAALSRRSFRVDVTHLSREQHELLTGLANGLPVHTCLFAPTTECPEVNQEVVLCRWGWIKCWTEWQLLVGESNGFAS